MTAKIHLNSDLMTQVLEQKSCYTGRYQLKSNECEILKTNEGFVVKTTKKLLANENITFAIAFKKDTFKNFKTPWWVFSVVFLILSFILFIIGRFVKTFFVLRSLPTEAEINKDLLNIEYTPYKKIDFAEQLIIMGKKYPSNFAPAYLMHLAVNHKILLIEQKDKSLYKKNSYIVKKVPDAKYNAFEKLFLTNYFGQNLEKDSYAISSEDYKMSSKIESNIRYATKNVEAKRYYYPKNKIAKKRILIDSLWTLLIFAMMMIVLPFLETSLFFKYLYQIKLINEVVNSQFLIVICVSMFLLFIKNAIKVSSDVLTDKGIEVKKYLEGLKKFITMTEKERLEFSQSVENVQKIDLGDNNYKLNLYEKLLPYAMMFGLEKKWISVLMVEYVNNNTTPVWISGDINNFSKSMHGFMTAYQSSSSTYDSSGSSSSGSGGGGFSGGGGGGW